MAKPKKITKKKPESKSNALTEAQRYLANAKETLRKSAIENGTYQDEKYVKEACGIAYLAALLAIDGWLVDRDLWSKKATNSIQAYQISIKKHPKYKALNNYLNAVYETLHLLGYYYGSTNKNVIKEGLDNVNNIIDLIDSY